MSNDLNTMLKQQAGSLSPAFDESLHVRTMQRLNQTRRQRAASTNTEPDPTSNRVRHLVTGGAIAAAVVIALTLIVGNPFSPKPTAEDLARLNQAFASIRESASPIEQQFWVPVNSAERQLTLLGDDARAFGNFVAQRLNVFTSDQSL